MKDRWDVIIVGARCAGASLATLLARAGQRVLLLEASSRGTGMPQSTHLVHAPGMDVLDTLGLGDRVRAVTPPTRHFRFALDGSELISEAAPGRDAYCIRRSTLDPWLQDAAESAGTSLYFRHRVVDVLRVGERVTGVVVRTPAGFRRFTADLVVGADGRRSTVADLVNAEEYLVSESNRAGYWSYYPAPSRWTAAWDATLEHRAEHLRYVFRCDGEQVLLTYVGTGDAVRAWGRARDERLRAALADSPSTGPLSADKRPVGPSMGLLHARFFYRRPVGPGYALVGDAGHFKDFVTGQGMTDAFLDAKRLAGAIVDGRDEAFAAYWRGRDALTLPLHQDAIRQGDAAFNEPFMRWVIAHMAEDAALRTRLHQVMDRKLEPAALIPARTMLGYVASALVRGRFDVVRGFVAMGRPMREEARERARRHALYREAAHALAAAPSMAQGRQPLPSIHTEKSPAC
jgi:flavin-dependent dehydrogenase